jgi:formiminotetrahydrofolate cyclodeaminase
MSFATEQIGAFLDTLASKTPTPGGGAVAALTGAMAAGLGEMVVAYSMTKRLAAHRADLERTGTELAGLRRALLEAADADAVAYARLNESLKFKERTPVQESVYRAALVSATDAPASVARLSVRVLEVLDALGDRWNINLASDMAMAARLAQTAAQSAAWNVRMNEPLARAAGVGTEILARVATDTDRAGQLGRRIEDRAAAAMKP